MIGRIDTHQHVVPPEYRDLLTESWTNPGHIPIPSWTPSAALDLMGHNGIETGILSVSEGKR